MTCIQHHPPRKDLWFLFWEAGGRIVLVASFSEEALCPSCGAPMLILEDQAVCYACGTTFSRAGRTLCLDFGTHRWPGSACGKFLAYDPSRDAGWYEGLRPEDVA